MRNVWGDLAVDPVEEAALEQAARRVHRGLGLAEHERVEQHRRPADKAARPIGVAYTEGVVRRAEAQHPDLLGSLTEEVEGLDNPTIAGSWPIGRRR
jgi:hypothetical protein